LSSSILQNTVSASQAEINQLQQALSTGLKINSASDDPANLYVSDKLNLQALEAASTSTNAQSGLTYLQVAQNALDSILKELTNVQNIANLALSGNYTDSQLQAYQDQITNSINNIKLIEEGTTYNGINVFNNSNSTGSVNEHMFAVTTKEAVTVTTVTTVSDRGTDYSSYLSNNIDRYDKLVNGDETSLVNSAGDILTPSSNLITIETADQLVAALNGTNTAGKTYILLDNIDLSSLGTKSSALLSGTFQGTLLGNGYAISGLSISSTGDNVGLFEQMGSSASVQDLILKDFTINGNNNVGTLAGKTAAGSTIDNVAVVNATVVGNQSAGGLVGYSNGAIVNSYTTGKVAGDALSMNVGALVGRQDSSGSITNSFSSADVIGGTNVGGIAGYNYGGNINSVYSRGTVSGKVDVGGLAGYNTGTIKNTYTLGDVSGQTNTAGLVGYNTGSIDDSYSLSTVTDTTTTYDINNFETVSTGENVSGLAERPNDAYNIVYDYGGNTYAFNNLADYNNFLDYTHGVADSEISLFYQKDSSTNTWYGKKLQATDMFSYSVSNLADTPVQGVPKDTYGASYSVVYNVAAGGYAGTYAFASETDLNNFLAYTDGNGSTTPDAEISKFYKLTAASDTWTAQNLQFVNNSYALSAPINELETVGTPNDPYASYDVVYNVASGGYAGTYAFASEADRQAFQNFTTGSGSAPVAKYYKSLGNNTWQTQTLAANATTYASSSVSGAVSVINTPNSAYGTFDVMYTDGSSNQFAFASQADKDAYVNKTGEVSLFYQFNTGSKLWDSKKQTLNAGSGNYTYATSAITNVGDDPNDTLDEYVYLDSTKNSAFASAEDLATFNNGSFTGAIAKFYSKQGDGTWKAFKITATGGSTNYTVSNNIDGAGYTVSTAADASDNYGIIKNIGGYNYAFSSETDASNFNDGTNFLGSIGKYYKQTGANSWQAYSIKANPQTTGYSNVDTGTNVGSTAADATIDYSIVASVGGKTLAFSNVTDQSNYNDGTTFLGNIGKYYEKQGDGTWKAYSVTSSGGTASYGIQSTGSSTANALLAGDGSLYQIYGSYAFSSTADKNAFNNGSPTGAINLYFENVSGTWTAKKVTGASTQTAAESFSTTYNGTAANDAAGFYSTYTYQKTYGGQTYAFASQADANKFVTSGPGSGQFTGYLDNTYYYVETSRNVWKQFQVNYTAEHVGAGYVYDADEDEATIDDMFWSDFGTSVTGPPSTLMRPANWTTMGSYKTTSAAAATAIKNHYSTGESGLLFGASVIFAKEGYYNNGSGGAMLKAQAMAVETEALAPIDGGSGTMYGILAWELVGETYTGSATGNAPITITSTTSGSQMNHPDASGYTVMYTDTDGSTLAFKATNERDGYILKKALGVNYYKWNNATGKWDGYTTNYSPPIYATTYTSSTTTNPGVSNTPSVGGYTNIANIGGSIYAFASAADQSAFNNGSPTSGINSYYKWNGSTWDQYKVAMSGATTTYSKNDLSSTVSSRVNDPNYDLSYNDGTYNYYFNSLGDKNTFTKYQSGTLGGATFSDVYYYRNVGSGASTTWEKLKLSSSINPTTYSNNSVGSTTSKPNDSSYQYNYYLDSSNNYYFDSSEARDTFSQYINGTLTGAITPTYYYKWNGSNWDLGKLTSNTSGTSYSASAYGTANVAGSPNTLGYEIIANDDQEQTLYDESTGTFKSKKILTNGTSTMGGTTYAFNTLEDKDNFQKYLNGELNNNTTIYYYQKINNSTWQQKQLTSNLTADAYSVASQGTSSVQGRPDKEGFDTLSADGQYAFANASDLYNYNNGSLRGEIGLYYQYNSGTNKWDAKQVKANATTYAVTTGSNVSGQPNDSFSLTSTIGGNLYAFQSVVDKTNFTNASGTVDLMYKYDTSVNKWKAYSYNLTSENYAINTTGTTVQGAPDDKNFKYIQNISGSYYAFRNATDYNNYVAAQAHTTSSTTEVTPVDKFYKYNTGNNTWQAQTVNEAQTESYGIAGAGVANIAGLAERPTTAGYTYLLSTTKSGYAGTYAFESAADKTSFQNFLNGSGAVNPIDNYYKLNTTTKKADSTTGKMIDTWDSQSLKYDNNVGYLVGTNTGSVTDSFFGTGDASASYIGDDGVYMLGTQQIKTSSNPPINTWSSSVWNFTGTRPTLKNQNVEGSEDINPNNLGKLEDEKAYSYKTVDSYNTKNVTLNTALNNYSANVSVSNSAQLTYAQALAAGYNAAHVITSASDFVSKINADKAGSFIITSDVDMSTLGTLNNSAITGTFTGKLDGNGHKVSGLTIDTNNAAVNNIGLFSQLSGATIKNLGLENVSTDATNSTYVGGLAGIASNSTITNTYAVGYIDGKTTVGGLVGNLSNSTLSYSSSSGAVTGTTSVGTTIVGGLIGDTYNSTISNDYSTATVLGDSRLGGLIGNARKVTITNSWATGDVSGRDAIGGLIGITTSDGASTIKNTYATGNVTASGSYAGGLIGYSQSWMAGSLSITNSYAEVGTISGAGNVGGLIGKSEIGTIDATNFYKNNMSTSAGSAINANIAAAPTSSWDSSVWNLTDKSAPTLRNFGIASDIDDREKLISVQFATNKYISGMNVYNAADSDEKFSEGKDFVVYSNDNGATWQMDIISDAMKGKSIKIDYQGVDKSQTNSATSGFDIYLGNGGGLNIKDMVLDLAGRMNFDITTDGGASGTIDAVKNMQDYINNKELRLSGSIAVATNALTNKQTKNTALASGVSAIRDADKATVQAQLLKLQILQQNANSYLNTLYDYQSSAAKTLIGSAGSTSVGSGIYGGLTGIVNSNNDAALAYYYNLYDDAINTTATTGTTRTTGATNATKGLSTSSSAKSGNASTYGNN
jgi:hypothetical protein